jgi:hypothetical protein
MADPVRAASEVPPGGQPSSIDPELDRGLRHIERGFAFMWMIGIGGWIVLLLLPFMMFWPLILYFPVVFIGCLIGGIRVRVGLRALGGASATPASRRLLRLARIYFLLIPAAGLVFFDTSIVRAVVCASGLSFLLLAAALVATALALRETARERALEPPKTCDARACIRAVILETIPPAIVAALIVYLFIDRTVVETDFVVGVIFYVAVSVLPIPAKRLSALAGFLRDPAGGEARKRPTRPLEEVWLRNEAVPSSVRERYTRRMWSHLVLGLCALGWGTTLFLLNTFACFVGWIIVGASRAERTYSIRWLALLTASGGIAVAWGLQHLRRSGVARRVAKSCLLRAIQASFAASAACGLAVLAASSNSIIRIGLIALFGLLFAALAGTTFLMRRLAIAFELSRLARAIFLTLMGWLILGFGLMLLGGVAIAHGAAEAPVDDPVAGGLLICILSALLAVLLLAGILWVNIRDFAQACERQPADAGPADRPAHRIRSSP